MKVFCSSPREYAKNAINFEKEENVFVNKIKVKIASGCNSMLHLWKNIRKKVC